MKKLLSLKNICFSILFSIFIFNSQLTAEEWWHVYFTNPCRKASTVYQYENPETALIRLIVNAKKSFYGAFYDITSGSVIKEIINADKRGIDVRLVIEKDNIRKKETSLLVKTGIKIVTDNRKALMHNKFAVIDGDILWTGSYNLTNNDANKNDNNAIELHSADVAKMYIDEFNEMYTHKIFGNKKEFSPFSSFRKKYYAKIEETNINVYFSPDDNVERIITERLKKTEKSVHFMAFSFTSDRIGDEMIRLYKNGIKVYGIMEKIGSDTRESEYTKFKIEGVLARLDKNKKRMHNKVIIIDEKIVITGSYNYSKNANEKNDENIIILDNKEIARLYVKKFNELYK